MKSRKKRFRISIQTKIALLIIGVVGLAVVNISVYIARWRMAEIRRETETNILNIAKIVSSTPAVKSNLGHRENMWLIQKYVEDILVSTENVDVIVVADMGGIRYAHPNKERLGERFVGGDEVRVLEKGEIYTSEAEGTLGKQIRAFVPIYNNEFEQVGFTMVGRKILNYERTRLETVKIVFFAAFVSLIIGSIGALLLSQSIKKTLLGLEPEEISELYLQRNAMLDAMHEGIIAVDRNFKITMINNSAIKMFGFEGKQIAGRDIRDFYLNSKLGETLEAGIPEYFKEMIINDINVVVNRIPIMEGDKVVGAIATFSDKTIVTQLAEEVTGVRQIVDALRANTHEFMNKLHVILGLIQLGELDEARKYILDETSKQQNILSLIMGKIKDSTVAGLILGKISRGKELGIDLLIDDSSFLEKRHGRRINSHMIITILGNLIENSMDAVMQNEERVKKVSILIKESEGSIRIVVEDTGHGIIKKDIAKIFERGYSTKEGTRGTGLFLVKEVVEMLGGHIEVASEVNKGTKFVAILPKGGQSK